MLLKETEDSKSKTDLNHRSLDDYIDAYKNGSIHTIYENDLKKMLNNLAVNKKSLAQAFITFRNNHMDIRNKIQAGFIYYSFKLFSSDVTLLLKPIKPIFIGIYWYLLASKSQLKRAKMIVALV